MHAAARAVLAALALSLLAPPAHADDALAQAKAHYAAGEAFYNAAHYAEAAPRWPGPAFLGTGLALLVGGAIAGGLALHDSGAIHDGRGEYSPDLADLAARGQTSATVSAPLLAMGGALAVAGIALTVWA